MKNYPSYNNELARLMQDLGAELPEQMKGFTALHKAAVAEGALSTQTKELIALGIAITVRCDGCIAYHVDAAIQAGCRREEIMETIGVAILMGGGPSVVYGAEAMAAMNQFMVEEVAK